MSKSFTRPLGHIAFASTPEDLCDLVARVAVCLQIDSSEARRFLESLFKYAGASSELKSSIRRTCVKGGKAPTLPHACSCTIPINPAENDVGDWLKALMETSRSLTDSLLWIYLDVVHGYHRLKKERPGNRHIPIVFPSHDFVAHRLFGPMSIFVDYLDGNEDGFRAAWMSMIGTHPSRPIFFISFTNRHYSVVMLDFSPSQPLQTKLPAVNRTKKSMQMQFFVTFLIFKILKIELDRQQKNQKKLD